MRKVKIFSDSDTDNVSYVVEDVEVPNVSKYKYEINYNPKMWVPVKLKNVD